MSMKIPRTVRQHWVYETVWTEEKERGVGVGFRNEEGGLQVTEEEQSGHGQGILARYSEMWAQGVLANKSLSGTLYLSHLIPIRLRQAS